MCDTRYIQVFAVSIVSPQRKLFIPSSIFGHLLTPCFVNVSNCPPKPVPCPRASTLLAILGVMEGPNPRRNEFHART